MSMNEYKNCIYARQVYDPSGSDHGYSCGACKRHYCRVEEGSCPYYKSKYIYKMEWIRGAGNEDIRVAVPKFGPGGEIYANKRRKKAVF